jgi:hypothetical protein
MAISAFTKESLRMSSGAIVWALHFGVVYGLTALACARGYGQAIPWVIGVATILAGAAVVVVMRLSWPHRHRFEGSLMFAIAGLSLVAIVWETVPLLLLGSRPLCA